MSTGGKLILYDSRIGSKLPPSMEKQLAQIYCDLADDTKLAVTRAATQQQIGGTDCGLFSIAFAYHAAKGGDASKPRFDQQQMR